MILRSVKPLSSSKNLMLITSFSALLILNMPNLAFADVSVANCAFQAECWYSQSPTPWSYDLSLDDLKNLGVGKVVTLQSTQVDYYVVRLGATNILFHTMSGDVTKTLPEFNGSYYTGYCDPCEVRNVGSFAIPKDVQSATISGTFGNSQVSNTAADNLTLLSAGASLQLVRETLTRIEAVGAPGGGKFSYSTDGSTGGDPSTLQASSVTTNPNIAVVTAPTGSGQPTPGSLTSFSAVYTRQGSTASASFSIPAFGTSCYMVALEADYGSPGQCASTRINGTKISGVVTNPPGISGTYCRSFIANVKLQGSGQLNSGSYIHYNANSASFESITQLTGSDNTPVVAGQTLARDRRIIPGKGVLVDIDGVGNGLLANDTGGAIKGYRVDLFEGAGKAVCAGYSNPIAVSACETPLATCPGIALQ